MKDLVHRLDDGQWVLCVWPDKCERTEHQLWGNSSWDHPRWD